MVRFAVASKPIGKEASDSFIREGQRKLRRPKQENGGELELYDLATDPADSVNVALPYPEIAKKRSATSAAWIDNLSRGYAKTTDTQDRSASKRSIPHQDFRRSAQILGYNRSQKQA